MHIDARHLQQLAEAARGLRGCAACAPLKAPGWESLPAGFDTRLLHCVGTLRAPASDRADAGAPPDEPTWQEYHPQGTRTDSPRAPIAPAFHPCNRSDLHACKACGKLFLRYTEGGGYYVDARVRELDPDLIAP